MKQNILMPENKTQIHEIVADLYELGGLKPAEIKAFKTYKEELEKLANRKEFYLRHTKNDEQIIKEYETIEAELEWVKQTTIYRNDYASLFNMNQLVEHLFSAKPDNSFFEFQQLVRWVNAYFKITNPYKPVNKIAYGWNFALDKSKPYLFACIRNYLQKNGVEFTTLELQKICALKIVDTNGE